MALSESVRKQITGLLASNRTVLFMKGTPRNPQCGFSAQVVRILEELLPSYETVNVLSSPELRDGIKEFSPFDRGEVIVFDLRPEDQRVIATIAAARPLDAAGQKYLFGLDRETPVAFHCHLGMRSQEAGEQLLREGFRSVYNLKGGIDAWSQTVDPSVPRY